MNATQPVAASASVTGARTTDIATGTSATSELAITTPDLTIIDGKVTTTSLQIAEHFGKRHADVLRAIKNMDCQKDFTDRNFALSEFTDSTGRTLPCYRITRQGFSFLAMGFTGKEAAQWKVSYLETFDRMEAELSGNSGQLPTVITTAQAQHRREAELSRIPLQLPTTITPAQAQHLRELVQLVVESGKQGYPDTWSRLHRKMKVNSYLMLRPDQFDAACEYLHGKMDDTSIAAIAAKHFPQLAAPAQQPALQELTSPKIDGSMLAGMIKAMSAADLYAVNVAATMEVWMRTQFKGVPA